MSALYVTKRAEASHSPPPYAASTVHMSLRFPLPEIGTCYWLLVLFWLPTLHLGLWFVKIICFFNDSTRFQNKIISGCKK